jgi:hypothetical protein
MAKTLKEQSVKYPNVKVQLTGSDGNAFVILGKVMRNMRKEGISQSEIDDFCDEASSGDYDHLLRTCMKWVDVS